MKPLLRVSCLIVVATTSLLVATSAPQEASAFCGFYVSGGSGSLTNAATMTVMMREGMRTVLSMQNNYQGPPEDFAMVIPVPVVLKEKEVKTLPGDIFAKVDAMASPRLVEYWEQDPCAPEVDYDEVAGSPRRVVVSKSMIVTREEEAKVKIEAQFKVGEYEIVILSAKESTALDAWLRSNKYNIPKGAEAVLRPYVEGGMYFFVAKVDTKKVKFEGDRAKLSPLRFHYDAESFSLPIRLGLLNADGPQELLVHILARNQRFEVANYPNATLPTNLDVADSVRKDFPAFVNALFDKTQQKHPGAVITEYAWDASTCDPCPGPNLNGQDFLTLGADVLPGQPQYGFVLTRLHARYTKEQATEDLIFKAAPPIAGGREHLQVGKNELEEGAVPAGQNNFQGRYAIRHLWEGKMECQSPRRGLWGGPPGGALPRPTAAQDAAFAPRAGLNLPAVLRRDAPEIGLTADLTTQQLLKNEAPAQQPQQPASAPTSAPEPAQAPAQAPASAPSEAAGKSCAVTPGTPAAGGWGGAFVAGLAAAVIGWRWRRRT